MIDSLQKSINVKIHVDAKHEFSKQGMLQCTAGRGPVYA